MSIPNSPPSEIMKQSKLKKKKKTEETKGKIKKAKTYRKAEAQILQKVNVEKFLK